MSAPKVLMIVTSHDQLGSTGKPTGVWLEELAVPYREFQRQGFQIDLASPQGGAVPIDPSSLNSTEPDVKAFLVDANAAAKVKHTLKLSDVKQTYDAYFIPGGHGAAFDLPLDATLQKMLATAFEQGRTVAAVCHGPAALANVRLKNGDPIVKGRKVTGFTDAEEQAAGYSETVPFLIETTFKSQGGRFEGKALWQPNTVRDGNLITGQNPASSRGVAKGVIEALSVAQP